VIQFVTLLVNHSENPSTSHPVRKSVNRAGSESVSRNVES